MPNPRALLRSLDHLASIPSILRPRILAALPTLQSGRLQTALASLFANCGGRNTASRFAGELVRTDLSHEALGRIYHALILRNGVRKTSQRARNKKQLLQLLASGRVAPPPRVRVLDMGSSLGLDALATAELLRARGCEIAEYVLGDLHPRVLYDPARGLVFDEDGTLLQVRRGRSFVSIHFSYTHAFQRVTHAPKHLVPWLLRRRHRFATDAPLVSIPLVDPSLRVDDPASPFRLRRLDVFGPFDGEFDLILCMNLLLPQYFGAEDIERGTRNLVTHLVPGGTAVVGGGGKLRVIHRESAGRSPLRERQRGGRDQGFDQPAPEVAFERGARDLADAIEPRPR